MGGACGAPRFLGIYLMSKMHTKTIQKIQKAYIKTYEKDVKIYKDIENSQGTLLLQKCRPLYIGILQCFGILEYRNLGLWGGQEICICINVYSPFGSDRPADCSKYIAEAQLKARISELKLGNFIDFSWILESPGGHFGTSGASRRTSWFQVPPGTDPAWTLPGPSRRASWRLPELILGPT